MSSLATVTRKSFNGKFTAKIDFSDRVFYVIIADTDIIKENNYLRGMVKNMPLLRRVGNNGRPWVHAVMCVNTYSDICMIIHGDSCFNLVNSANRYWLHMTVHSTTRAYNGTIATKGLFIMRPSANTIRIKDKLILRDNDSGIYFRI